MKNRTNFLSALVVLVINTAIVFSQPSGTTDVALNKKATASSMENGYTAQNTIDGDANSRWASIGSDDQWLMIDLQDFFAISQVAIQWEAAFGKDYDIQFSNDTISWRTGFEYRNGNGTWDTINVIDTARYIKLKGIKRGTAWGYSIFSFKVFGVKNTVPILSKIIIEKTINTVYTDTLCVFIAKGYDQFNHIFKLNNKLWTSEPPSYITVGGAFYTNKAGTYTIKITSGKITSSIKINVIEKSKPTSLTLSTDASNIKTGDSTKITAILYDQYKNAVNQPIIIKIKNNDSILSAQYLKLTKAGIYEIQATYLDITSSCILAVHKENQTLTSIKLSPDKTTIAENETILLSAKGYDSQDEEMFIVPEWKALNGNIINGAFTPNGPGNYIIIAKIGAISDTASIEVTEISKLTSLSLLPVNPVVHQGDTLQFNSKALDQNNNVLNLVINWVTDNPNLILNEGKFVASFTGKYLVKCTSGGFSDSTYVYVYPKNTTNIAFNMPAEASTNTQNAGSAIDNNTDSRWESDWINGSDPQWLTVDLKTSYDLGAVTIDWETANAKEYILQTSYNGTDWNDIYHKYNGESRNHRVDSIPVFASGRYVRILGLARSLPPYGYSIWELKIFASDKATARQLNEISITPSSASLLLNDSIEFKGLALDQYKSIYDVPVYFKNSSLNGTIDNNGKYKTLSEGIDTITAYNDGIKAKAIVKIKTQPHLSKIVIAPKQVSVRADYNIQFYTLGYDQYGDPFSINEAYKSPDGEIDAYGLYFPVTAGSHTVIVSVGEFTDTAYITATEIPLPDTIIITPQQYNLYMGDSIKFTAKALDANGKLMDSKLSWTTTTGGLVKQNGTFIGALPGTYSIYASAGSVKGIATVVVKEKPHLNKIVVTPATANIKTGEKLQLIASSFDQMNNEFVVAIKWEVVEGANITATGLFSSSEPGTFTINAINGDVKGTAKVTVTKAITNIERENLENISAFPNPCHTELKVKSIEIIKNITIIDLTGRNRKNIIVNSNSFVLNTTQVPNGQFFLRIETAKGINYKKMIKE